MIKKLSFKTKLLFSILPTAIAGMLVLSYVAFAKFNTTIEDQLIESKTESTSKMSDNIDTWLNGKLLEVREASVTPTAKNITSDLGAFNQFNLQRMKYYNEKYPNEYDDAGGGLFDNSGVMSVAYGDQLKVVNNKVKPWYQALMAGNEYVISNPVISKGSGRTLVVIGVPIKDDNSKSVGFTVSAVNLAYIQNKVQAFKYGNKGYSLLISSDGTILVDPDKSLVMKKKISEVKDETQKALGTEMLKGKSGVYRFTKGNEKYIAFYNKIDSSGWRVASVVNENELFAPARELMHTLILITILIAVIFSLIILFVAKKLTNPLSELSTFSAQIAAGNLTGKIQVKNHDEVGKVAHSLNDTVDKLKEMIGNIDGYTKEVKSLSKDLTLTTSDSIHLTNEVARCMQETSDASIKQAENATEASKATEELSLEINDVLKQCENMMKLVEVCKEANNRGAVGIKETIESIRSIEKTNDINVQEVKNLHEHSKKIGQIVDVIGSIASQTDLLALNASIEAARAGEHGKGFAVVANEVKNLAEQSGEAVKEIIELIKGIEDQVETIVNSMKDSTSNVNNGVNVAGKVEKNFAEIENSFSEVISSVNMVLSSSNNMDKKSKATLDNVTSVAAITEENSAASEEVLASMEQNTASMHEINGAAEKLDGFVVKLKEAVDKFKY